MLTGCPADIADYNPQEVISTVQEMSSSEESSDYAPEGPSANSTVSLPESSSSGEEATGSSSREESSSSSESSSSDASAETSSSGSSASSSQAVSSQSSSESVSQGSGSSGDSSSSPSQSSASEPEQEEEEEIPAVSNADEVRAVWFSYLDMGNFFTGEQGFRQNIANAFDNVVSLGMNTVYMQVRPFGDAYYESDYFPWSARITGTEGVDPGYDPLSIMIEEARDRGLRIEAWLNPYRVRANGSISSLSEDNPAKIFYNEGSNAVKVYNGGIYYNPASEDARQLILDGVMEIVQGYDIDGIHFDDYFYPSPDNSFDAQEYSEYQQSGGQLSLAAWRRENVNILVRDIYSAIKSYDSSLLFGISPQGNMKNNLNSQYIDVDTWLTNSGYVDYICPQIYWGFEHSSAPFAQMVDQWNAKIKLSGVELLVGMAPYKLGDSQYGSEWVGSDDLLARMIEKSRQASHYGGFAMYSYTYLFGNSSQLQQEQQSIKDIL